MIAKLAKTCTLRISPDKLNFILSDKLASGGVSMWCELEQVSRSSQEAPDFTQCHWKARKYPFSSLRRTFSANFKWRVFLQKTMRFI